ncbi:MAG: hypothetical protein ABEI86_10795 [Halobacteriaceae archaeon]
MCEKHLLTNKEKEKIKSTAEEKGITPEQHASELLEKGRKFERVSDSRERLVDEIKQVRSNTKKIDEVDLPSEIDGAKETVLPDSILESGNQSIPYGWMKLTEQDQRNIRRYAWYRKRQQADDAVIFHEVETLVGLGAFKFEDSLSSATLEDLDEPANRSGRAPDRFFRFIGNHPTI